MQFPPQKGTSRSSTGQFHKVASPLLRKEISLTTRDDENIAAKLRWLTNRSAKVEELSNSSRLAILGGIIKHVLVKVAGAEEVDVDADAGEGRNVARGVLVLEGVDAAYGGKVAAEDKVGQVVGELREASEDDGVGELGVEIGEAVAHDGAKGVADVDVLVEFGGDAADVAVVDLLSKRAESLNLKRHLDLVDGVLAVVGVRNAEAVPGERGVALLNGAVDVRVVVVVEGVVPV